MNRNQPNNEAERLAALHQTKILDTPPEPIYDEAAQMAASICGTPISAVSLPSNQLIQRAAGKAHSQQK